MEAHSGTDVILDMQSLGPGRTVGLNGRQGRRATLVSSPFRKAWRWWNRLTCDFWHKMVVAGGAFFSRSGQC